MGVNRKNRRLLLVGLLTLVATGCFPALPLRQRTLEPAPRPLRPRTEVAEPLEPAREPGTLDELLDIAVKHHPDLSAAQSRVEVARGHLIQVGLYPNPIIGPHFASLGDSANRLGDAGATFTQPIVTNGKLKLAKAAAARGVEAADWQALTRWHEVNTRVRLAYFELLTALREQDTMQVIVSVSGKAHQTALSLEKGGAGNRPDVLRAKVELEQNLLKREVAARRVEAAEQNLLTALGRPALALDRLKMDRKELERTPPEYDWKIMLACLRDSSSELQEARARIAQQERLLAKANADRVPNVNVTAIPFYSSDVRELRTELIVTAPLPIFDRNQGNIHAAKHELALAAAAERQLELRLTERLTAAYQRYQSAHKQADAYRNTIVPDAETSLKLIDAGWRGGDKKYDYTAVLQAQQVESQARLAQTQALGELWRSISEIAGILQHENLLDGCGMRENRGTVARFGVPIPL